MAQNGVYEWWSPGPFCEATRRVRIFAISPLSFTRSLYCVSKQPAKILTRLRGCADWSGSQLFAFVLRCLFSAPGPNILLGPVVQSIVSITSSLVVKILTALISRISDSQVLFAAKMWAAFAKATHILSAKILAYMPYLTIKVLTIR